MLKKKEKLAHQQQRKNKIKEVKFNPRIAEGDYERKLEQIREFISEGYQVKITVQRRRRITKEELEKFLDKLLTNLENWCKILTVTKKSNVAYILVKAK